MNPGFAIILTALVSSSGHAVQTAAVESAPAVEGPAPSLRALHFADFGARTRQQASVAAAMVRSNRRSPVDLAISSGDNIYEDGPNSDLPSADRCSFGGDDSSVAPSFVPPPDPRFDMFEKPLRALASPKDGRHVPIYLVLGNHDVADERDDGAETSKAARVSRRKACLEVAHRSPQWIMPARHYVLDHGPARFIGIDSNLLSGDYGHFTFDSEVEFVRAAAAGCMKRRCFLIAHHPPASAGIHAREDAAPDRLARVARLEAAAGGHIVAWLVGHDHDLQHLRTATGKDVFVSGNSADGRPDEAFERVPAPGARLLFASTAPGYGRLEVSATGWTYRFENDRGQPLHCCAAVGLGPCESVKCGMAVSATAP